LSRSELCNRGGTVHLISLKSLKSLPSIFLAFTLLMTVSWPVPAFSSATCLEFFKSELSKNQSKSEQRVQFVDKSTASVSELKMATFNAQDLSLIKRDNPSNNKKGKYRKHSERANRFAEMIFDLDLDIVAFQEIAGRKTAEEFARVHLKNQYDYYSIEKRDLVQVFFVKKNLPFKFEVESTLMDEAHYGKNKTPDPMNPGKGINTRMPMVLTVKDKNNNPLFSMINVHLKSKKGGAKKTQAKRSIEVRQLIGIFQRLRSRYGFKIPVFLFGDMNTSFTTAQSFKPLFEQTDLVDSFDHLNKPPPPRERSTFDYSRKGKPTQHNQIDGILSSRNIESSLDEIYVYSLKNGEKALPSDHRPIIMKINFTRFKKILEELMEIPDAA